MKRCAALFLAVLTGSVLAPAPADAAPHAVSIQNFGFTPKTLLAGQGDTVTWTQNDVGVQHTSTSDQGFWASAHLSQGRTYSQRAAFQNAGSYAYHCAIHTEMTGTVRVRLNVTGSATHGYTLRWSSLVQTPSNRSFDVQIERPGATKFAVFRGATTTHKAFVNPAQTGTYKFRARTRNLANGKQSGWSPIASLPIS